MQTKPREDGYPLKAERLSCYAGKTGIEQSILSTLIKRS